jgi:hypothetical protein
MELAIVSLISLEKYFLVVHRFEKSINFWVILLIIYNSLCAGIFLYGFIKRDNNPTPSHLNCFPYLKPSKLSSIMSIFISLLYLIPCYITTFCYFVIGWRANKQLNQIKNQAISTCDQVSLDNIKLQKRKLLIQLTMVFIMYNGNFILSYVAWVLKFAIGFKRTPIYDAIAYTTVQITAALNSIVTVTFQPDVNTELNIILLKLKTRFKEVIRRIL